MPKILEKVREQLLAEAERQIAERGYARTTIRSVAGACGIAVGTVYNYFPSKDVLVASFMAQDWQRCAAAAAGGDASDAHAYLSRIYDALRAYSERHRALFSDPDAARVFTTVFPARHRQLREQIAAWMLPLCPDGGEEERAFLAAFLAESLLSWTMDGAPFETIYSVLKKLL